MTIRRAPEPNPNGPTAGRLGEEGYEKRVAHDAPTALRIATEFTRTWAFSTSVFRVANAYELAAHLRSLAGLGELDVIAVTGYGQQSDRRKAPMRPSITAT